MGTKEEYTKRYEAFVQSNQRTWDHPSASQARIIIRICLAQFTTVLKGTIFIYYLFFLNNFVHKSVFFFSSEE